MKARRASRWNQTECRVSDLVAENVTQAIFVTQATSPVPSRTLVSSGSYFKLEIGEHSAVPGSPAASACCLVVAEMISGTGLSFGHLNYEPVRV